MTYSNRSPLGKGENQPEIQMLAMYDLDIAELEERLELASMLPADCWTNGCGGNACAGNGCAANACSSNG
ncbi:MAG TPA: hypothetical protein VKV19_08515 [Ktedonobacteraceae bacterium]|jgi:hypothetical protein|nr:hypothetical protein [Ktedonobacteraceae bacterium]